MVLQGAVDTGNWCTCRAVQTTSRTLYRVKSLHCCPCGLKLLRYVKGPMGLLLTATPALAMSYLRPEKDGVMWDTNSHPCKDWTAQLESAEQLPRPEAA